MTLGTHLLDVGVLVLRQQVGLELGDAGGLGDARRSHLVVARKHDEVLDAKRLELSHGLGNALLDGVGDGQHAHKLAAHGQVERRQPLGLHGDLRGLLVGDLDALVLDHEVARADHDALAVERARDAVGDDVLHLGVALAVLEVPLLRGAYHGAGHGVREVLLEAGGEAQHLVAAPAVERHDAREARRGLGEGAGLVEDDGVGGGDLLEVTRALDREAGLGALAHRGEHGDGARELEGARVVDHERGAGLDEAPRGECHDARKQEVPRHDGVGQVLAAALGLALEVLGLLDHGDDGAQLGAACAVLDAHEDLAVLHRGAGVDRVAHGALDGQRLAGEVGLVDHGQAALDRAVHADGHAGADDHEIAPGQLARRDGDLLVALDALGVLGHGKQRVDELVLGAGLGVVLERLADVEEEHRARGGGEVGLDERDAHGGGVEHRHAEVTGEQRLEASPEERAVRPHGPGDAERLGQEPAAHVVEAHELGNLHE